MCLSADVVSFMSTNGTQVLFPDFLLFLSKPLHNKRHRNQIALNACFCQDRYKCLGKYFGGRSYKCTVPSKFKHIQLDFLEFVQKSESGEGREEGKEKIMQLHNERLSCMQLGTTFVLSFSFGCFNEGSTLSLPIVAIETP